VNIGGLRYANPAYTLTHENEAVPMVRDEPKNAQEPGNKSTLDDSPNGDGSSQLDDLELQTRRLIAHEVTNSVRTAQSAAYKLSNFINRLPPSTQMHRQSLNWVLDINTHLSDIEAAIVAWSTGSSRSPIAAEAGLLTAALERAKSSLAAPTNFRNEFNTCVQPLLREMDRKRLRLDVDYIHGGLLLNIHPENIRIILNNLARNAINIPILDRPLFVG
jgi:signal transduction histidine kinase